MNVIGGNYAAALEPSTIRPASTPDQLRFRSFGWAKR